MMRLFVSAVATATILATTSPALSQQSGTNLNSIMNEEGSKFLSLGTIAQFDGGLEEGRKCKQAYYSFQDNGRSATSVIARNIYESCSAAWDRYCAKMPNSNSDSKIICDPSKSAIARLKAELDTAAAPGLSSPKPQKRPSQPPEGWSSPPSLWAHQLRSKSRGERSCTQRAEERLAEYFVSRLDGEITRYVLPTVHIIQSSPMNGGERILLFIEKNAFDANREYVLQSQAIRLGNFYCDVDGSGEVVSFKSTGS